MKPIQIDQEAIEAAANKAAQEAYESEVKDFISGYGSPFRKEIKEKLEEQIPRFDMKIPDVLTKINDALSDSVDSMLNMALADSYIPMVKEFFSGCPVPVNNDGDLLLSDILEKIASQVSGFDEYDADDFRIEMNDTASSSRDWMQVVLTTPESEYEFTLHKNTTFENGEWVHIRDTWKILGEARQAGYSESQKMKIKKGDIEVEIPFRKNILQDEVLSLIYKIQISDLAISLDCDSFPEHIEE